MPRGVPSVLSVLFVLRTAHAPLIGHFMHSPVANHRQPYLCLRLFPSASSGNNRQPSTTTVNNRKQPQTRLQRPTVDIPPFPPTIPGSRHRERRGSKVVMHWSAKPVCAGSIPALASILFSKDGMLYRHRLKRIRLELNTIKLSLFNQPLRPKHHAPPCLASLRR